MDYIHKIPFIIGASVTIIVGIVSYKSGLELKAVYIRMSVSMVAFFTAGVYLRRFISSINDEVNKKKEEEDLLKQQEQLDSSTQKASGDVHQIDYRVDDDASEDLYVSNEDKKLYDEEFTPLSVNSVTINKDGNN